MADQLIIHSPLIPDSLSELVAQIPHDRLFILADENVERLVFPIIEDFLIKFNPIRIIIPAGEEYKNLDTLSNVWEALCAGKASRSSLLINLGGGVITDLGGFAAASFKRGIPFINIPTTLLAAVDAAVGGKTGIDFMGLKNEIGAFAPAKAVIISPQPFHTLPQSQMISGFAEIVKMAMIAAADKYRQILLLSEKGSLDLRSPQFPLPELIQMAVEQKARIVKEDPKEAGLRKILNFGHTAGHAFETLLLRAGKPIPHGNAVAHGILVALILSHLRLRTDSILLHQYKNHILLPLFGRIPINCDNTDQLLSLMAHDKKNTDGKITFILLNAIGSPVISPATPSKDIQAALDIYLDLMQ